MAVRCSSRSVQHGAFAAPRAVGPTSMHRHASCACAVSNRHQAPPVLQWLNDVKHTSAAIILSTTLLAGGMFVTPEAQAVPQTSACATAPCDGQDLSNKDLRREFYTKGSLKGANFSNSNLKAVTFFGANLENANLSGADLAFANLGQANLDGANLSQANFNSAIMSSARFDDNTIIDGADFTDVIIRKDVNDKLCKHAKGTNIKTGVDTRESLNCF